MICVKIFGLHPNAELGYLSCRSDELFTTLQVSLSPHQAHLGAPADTSRGASVFVNKRAVAVLNSLIDSGSRWRRRRADFRVSEGGCSADHRGLAARQSAFTVRCRRHPVQGQGIPPNNRCVLAGELARGDARRKDSSDQRPAFERPQKASKLLRTRFGSVENQQCFFKQPVLFLNRRLSG